MLKQRRFDSVRPDDPLQNEKYRKISEIKSMIDLMQSDINSIKNDIAIIKIQINKKPEPPVPKPNPPTGEEIKSSGGWFW